jgi:hypothetical protein
VGKKLGYATLLMFTAPVITFFAVEYVVKLRNVSNPDNWAGGAAILVTNLIVAGYCYSAYKEDLNDDTKKDNDETAPRVGIYKQRLD